MPYRMNLKVLCCEITLCSLMIWVGVEVKDRIAPIKLELVTDGHSGAESLLFFCGRIRLGARPEKNS